MHVTTRNDVQAPAVKAVPVEKYIELAKQSQITSFNMWYSKLRQDANIVDKRLEIWGTNL